MQEVLAKYSDDLFLFQVLQYGTEIGTLEEWQTNDLMDGDLPALTNRVILAKKINFAQETEVRQAIRDTTLLVSLGLEIKAKNDLEAGVKVLMHPKLGIGWCFRKGNTDLIKLRKKAETLFRDGRLEFPQGSPAIVYKGWSYVSLLAKKEEEFLNLILFGVTVAFNNLLNKTTTEIYPLATSIKNYEQYFSYQKRFLELEIKLKFLHSLPLDHLSQTQGVYFLNLISDPLMILLSSLMLNLVVSGKPGYEVSLDLLDQFRARAWDQEKQKFRAIIIMELISWLKNQLEEQKASKEVYDFGIKKWQEALLEMSKIFIPDQYALESYGPYTGLGEFFILPIQIDFDDARLVYLDEQMYERAKKSIRSGEESRFISLYQDFTEKSEFAKVELIKDLPVEKAYEILLEHCMNEIIKHSEIAYILNRVPAEKVSQIFYIWETKYRQALQAEDLFPEERIFCLLEDIFTPDENGIHETQFLEHNLNVIFLSLSLEMKKEVKNLFLKIIKEG